MSRSARRISAETPPSLALLTRRRPPKRRVARAKTLRLRPLDFVTCLILLAGALALRVLWIDAPSLWVDEAASLGFARMGWDELWRAVPQVETNPPTYYALLKAWIAVAGTSEAALRLPGAIAGALAVPLLYLAGVRVLGRGAALVAAGFLALSAVQVAYAQETRVFPFVTLFFIAGLWMINEGGVALLRKRGVWPRFILLGLCVGLLPALHYSGFFVALVLLVYAVIHYASSHVLRRSALPLGVAAMIAAVCALPPVLWAAALAGDGQTPAGWLRAPTIWDAKWIYHEALGLKHLSFAPVDAVPPDWAETRLGRLFSPRRLGEVALALICALGLWRAWRRHEGAVWAPALALAFLCALFFAVSQLQPILIERTIIVAVPLLALIAGYSVMALRRRLLIWPAALLVLGFQAANLWSYYPQAEKEPWRAAIAEAQQAAAGRFAIAMPSGPYLPAAISTAVLVDYYWDGPVPPRFVTAPDHSAPLHDLVMTQTPALRLADPASFCMDFAGLDGLLVLYRRAAHAEPLLTALEDAGSIRRSIGETGLLGHQWRSGPKCTG